MGDNGGTERIPLEDKDLLEIAQGMRDQQDIAGLLYLHCVLTLALYRVTGRSHIYHDLTLP
jgi:hypothetical protein